MIRPVCEDGELEDVYRLTHDAYAERGYIKASSDGRLIHNRELDGIAETTVVVVVADGIVLGTNTLTLDGPKGLSVDKDFKEESDQVRAEGRTLASSWRLVTRTGYRDERKIVMGLIGETLRLGLSHGVTTCLFSLNPRHERVYSRLLNMKTIARSDAIVGFANAPAVLMRMDIETLPQWCKS